MNNVVSIPEIWLTIFLSSLGFIGGGNGAIPVIQERWVQTGLLDANLFVWAIGLGQIAPGPKIAFLAAIGFYLHGVAGASAALLGIILPTALSAAAMSYGMARLQPLIARVSIPAAFVVAGLMAAVAWDTSLPLGLNAYEIAIAGIIAWLIAWRNLDPVWIILGGVVVGLFIRFLLP